MFIVILMNLTKSVRVVLLNKLFIYTLWMWNHPILDSLFQDEVILRPA